MNEEIYFDEENQLVHVTDSELKDPDDNPLIVTYTYEEWEQLQEQT